MVRLSLPIIIIGIIVAVFVQLVRVQVRQSSGLQVSDSHIDFGDVFIEENEELILKHTFTLRNPTFESIRIEAIQSSCGCTTTELDSRELPPRGEAQLQASLHAGNSGNKSATISIAIEEMGRVTLSLAAQVHIRRRLVSSRPSIEFETDVDSADLTVVLTDLADDNEPGLLALEVPSGLRASASGWQRISTVNKETLQPARWHARVRFEIADRTKATWIHIGSMVRISLMDQELSIPVLPQVAQLKIE